MRLIILGNPLGGYIRPADPGRTLCPGLNIIKRLCSSDSLEWIRSESVKKSTIDGPWADRGDILGVKMREFDFQQRETTGEKNKIPLAKSNGQGIS
jgi:hypothetical protein